MLKGRSCPQDQLKHVSTVTMLNALTNQALRVTNRTHTETTRYFLAIHHRKLEEHPEKLRVRTIPLHSLLAATAETETDRPTASWKYCSLDMLKEVPPSTWHNLMLFKISTMCQASQVWCPDQGRRNTCSRHNHDTTVSWSTWGGKKSQMRGLGRKLLWVGRENSFCYRGLNSTSQFSSADTLQKVLNTIYESASH